MAERSHIQSGAPMRRIALLDSAGVVALGRTSATHVRAARQARLNERGGLFLREVVAIAALRRSLCTSADVRSVAMGIYPRDRAG